MFRSTSRRVALATEGTQECLMSRAGLTLYSARKQLNLWTLGKNHKLLKSQMGREHIYTEV